MAFHKAVKAQSKLRLALCGLAGTGKTYSTLAIASSLSALIRAAKQGDGRIAVIDSERGSARLYADTFDFDVCELEHFAPLAYVDQIHEAERSGYDIIIADSISHAWAGKGGALEQKDNIAARGGNSFTAWRDITPRHNEFVDAMVGCRGHFMATLRQKMEYVQQTVGGKTTIERVGLQSIQREGMEYEFTMVGDMDYTHTLKVSKIRGTESHGIDIGSQFERPGEALARKLYEWLMSGAPVAEQQVERSAPQSQSASSTSSDISKAMAGIDSAATLEDLEALVPQLKSLTGEAAKERNRRYRARKEWLTAQLVKQAAPAEPTETSVNDETDRGEPTATPAERREWEHGQQPEQVAARMSPPAPEAA